MKNVILANNGSIQNVEGIPKDIKDLYKTAWEIKQRAVIDLAAGRGPFVDQSQSMNLFVKDQKNIANVLTSIHLYAWKSGLKTGMYYLRIQLETNAIKFTVDPKYTKQLVSSTVSQPVLQENKTEEKQDDEDAMFCTMKEGCVVCGS